MESSSTLDGIQFKFQTCAWMNKLQFIHASNEDENIKNGNNMLELGLTI